MTRAALARQIIDGLGSHAPAAERRAVRRLVRLGPTARPMLRATLREHPNAHARAVAAVALARIDGPRARSTLIRALSDRTMVVRLHALSALHRLSWGRGAGPAVARLLRDPSGGVRISAIDVLAAHGERPAARAVASRLGDPKWYVRQHAARALGPLGDFSFQVRLERALSDERSAVREAARESLARLASQPRLRA